MNISKIIKKRMGLFIISLIFITLLSITSTYAFMNNSFVDNPKVINNENLKITYENGTEKIKNCSYPMSFQQGIKESPSNIIKIVNKGHFSTKFSLKINEISDDSDSIDLNKIYYSINNNDPKILGETLDGIIYNSNIKSNSEYIFDIKLWVASEFVENSDQGKSIKLKFEVLNNEK